MNGKNKGWLFLLLLLFWVIPSMNISASSTSSTGVVMTSVKGCYYYSSQSSAQSNRAGYLHFGETVNVTSLGETWSQFTSGGKTYYIYTSNLEYISYIVNDENIQVCSKAAACTTATLKGYLSTGDEIYLLDSVTGTNGARYYKCLIPSLYNAGRTKVIGTNVEGYVAAASAERKKIPYVAKTGTSLYTTAFSSSDDESLKEVYESVTAGQELNVLSSNSTWSKVDRDGTECYIYNSCIVPAQKQVIVYNTTLLERPISSAEVLASLCWNETVEVLMEYDDGTNTWLYVKADDQKGFVLAADLGYNTRMVTTNSVNIRSAASTSSEIAGYVLVGEEVEVEYSSTYWARIKYGDVVGYISMSNLQFPRWNANGKVYAAAKNIGGSSIGECCETVYLVAKDEANGYAYIKTESEEYYYIAMSDVSELVERQTVYVNKSTVSLYAEPKNSSTSIALPYMTQLVLVKQMSFGESGGWYEVEYQSSTYYMWINTDSNAVTTEESSYTYTGTETQQAVLDLAWEICRDWPTEYELGAGEGEVNEAGNHTFDCSGFVTYVLKNALKKWNPGYYVYAQTGKMIEMEYLHNEGLNGEFYIEHVGLDELQPGDVLFWDLELEDGEVDHCGLYMGNGEFVHSTLSFDTGVYLMPLSGMYVDKFMCAGRFIPEEFKEANEVRYVSNGTSKLREEPAVSSNYVEALKFGEPLTIKFLNQNGWAYATTTDNVGGFVLYNNVTPTLSDLSIVTNPVSVTAIDGENVQYEVEAYGDGLCYQWQYREGLNRDWIDISDGGDSAVLNLQAEKNKNGYHYRCRVTDEEGYIVYTEAVFLDVLGIIDQPERQLKKAGDTVTFQVTACGAELTYSWEYRTSATGAWKTSTAPGCKTTQLKISVTTAKSGYQYRCKVSDKAGNTLYTEPAYLYVLGIKTQPVTKKVKAGTAVSFSVAATGYNKKYQWQYRTSSSGTWKSATATGNKTATLKVSATTGRSGYQYRCKITDGAGNMVYSKAVYLYALGVKTQPATKKVKAGTTVSFKVTATGYSKKYQWQYRTSASGTWKTSTATGNKTAALKVSATTGRNGYQYRCKITDGAGNVIYTKAAYLYALGVKTQPVTQKIKAGKTASFKIAATGAGVKYQWQYRTSSSGTWKNTTATGNKTALLKIYATLSKKGYQYRCKITDNAGNVVYSKAATLNVYK